MQQKIFWSRWVHGRHHVTEFPSVHAALRAAMEAEARGTCGNSRILRGAEAEDLSTAKVLFDSAAVNHAEFAFSGAHPGDWRSRSAGCARKWQEICAQVKRMEQV